MRHRIRLITLLSISLITVSRFSFAESESREIFRENYMYGDNNGESVLIIGENSLLGTPACDNRTIDFPPYSISKATLRAIEWVNTSHPKYAWKLSSVELRYNLVTEGSCYYVVRFISKEQRTNNSSYISIGINMKGELIQPTVREKKK